MHDSGAFTEVSTSPQVDYANYDLHNLNFMELALLAIVIMLFFKWFIVDMFRGKF